MNTPRTIEGRWWLFGEDKPAHFGTLHYGPETGLKLEVKIAEHLTVHEIVAAAKNMPAFPQTIQGRDRKDRPITVFGCVCMEPDVAGGLTSYSFHSSDALIGHSLASWDSARYRKVRFHLSLLHKWMGRGCLQLGATAEYPLQVSILPKPDIEVEIGCGTKIRISYEYEHESGTGGYCIKEEHGVSMEFAQAISVQRIWVDYVTVLLRLITLFAGTKVFVENLSFEVADSGEPADWAEWLRRNEGITKADRDLHALDMNLHYQEIAADFPKVLNRWFEYHEKLDSALGLYFATVFNKNLRGDHQFLMLAQALEVYHNTNPRFIGSVQPTPTFRSRRDRILNSIPEDEKEWLAEKLHYANQKTLAQRLAEILGEHELSDFIPDPQSFAEKVRHTRNYYTHFDDDLRRKGKIAEGDELIRMVWQMRTLLGLCALKDLGIGGAPLSRIVQQFTKTRLVSLSTQSSLPTSSNK